MKKLKLLFISTACAVTRKEMDYGGIEKLLLDFVEPLAEEGHEITVAAPHGSEFPDPIHHFPTVHLPGHVWREDIAFKLIVEQNYIPDGFDILHDFSHQHYGGRITHGLWAKKYPFLFMLWHPPYFRGLPNRISEPAYNLCGIAKHQAEGLSKIYNQEIKWAYLGIDTERYALREDKSDRYLFLSVPNKEKGGLDAIKICRELNLKLDCIGGQLSDQPSDYAMEMRNLCDGRQIRWLGGVPETVKIEFLQRAKGLIFPVQQDEPFGLVMPEALSCGTPVFALNRGAVPEILIGGCKKPRCHYGVVANNLEELKEGIRKHERGELNVSPKRMRYRAVTDFDRRVMVKNWKVLYRLVMKGEHWY